MFCRYPCTQLEHATRARREPHAANSHLRTYAQHPALAIHKHHVDGVPHPDGVNARARRDEQTFGEIERLSDEKPQRTSPEPIRNSHAQDATRSQTLLIARHHSPACSNCMAIGKPITMKVHGK